MCGITSIFYCCKECKEIYLKYDKKYFYKTSHRGPDISNYIELDKAFLGFRTGNFNHGAQIKIRVLYHLSKPVHIFAELNAKSLGRRYDTFLIGFSYDFYDR